MSELYKYIKQGMNPKQAAARMLADKRKMNKGGAVEGSAGDLDQDRERNLAQFMIQGDQPPIANPEQQDAAKKLAISLQEEAEAEEYYAMGGLVEDMSGEENPLVAASIPENEADAKSAMRIMPAGLSDEAKKALERKKLMRKMK